MKKGIRYFILAVILCISVLFASCAEETPTNTLATPFAALEKRVGDLEKSYATLANAQTSVTKAQIDTVNAQIVAINASINTIQAQLAAPNPKIATVEADLAVTIGKVTALTNQIGALVIPNTAQLQASITALEASVATLKTNINDINTAINNLQTKNNAMQAEINILKAKVAVLETPPTTTVPPTTTTTVTIPASEAISVSIAPIMGTTLIEVPASAVETTQNYYLALTYTNTQNKQYTNVKFKVILYSSNITYATSAGVALTTLVNPTPVWALSYQVPNSSYHYQTINGITVGANATGEITLLVAIKYTSVAGGSIFAQAVVL